MEFVYSLVLAFENLKKFRNLALINGIVWFVIWSIVIFFSWDKMIDFTAMLLNFLPFSFIKSSGAFIIYSVLWLQAILVSIGLIFSFFNELIKKSYFLTISIVGIIVFVWSFVFAFFEKNIINYIEHLLKILPFNTIEELMSVFLGVLFYYLLFVATLSFSFLIISLRKLKLMAKEEYNLEVEKLSFTKLSFIIFRDFIRFMVLALIFYPLLLIPFVNFIFITLLFAFMMKDSLGHIALLFSESVDKSEVWVISIFSTFLNFLPVLNIFAPALGVLHLFYYTMEKNENF